MKPAFPPFCLIDPIIDGALEEDLSGGDLTTEACVEADQVGRALFIARDELVVCGLELAFRVFQRLQSSSAPSTELALTMRAHDGERVASNTVLMEVLGPARTLLGGERVALNFMQRLSGVSTLTRRYVDALKTGGPTRIADTRKTTPGLRILERYAVRCGGGRNHRDTLGSAVLIKDNHLVAAGSVKKAVARARASAPHTSRIECEVDSLTQLADALEASVDVVLLDNMDEETVAHALSMVRALPNSRVIVEVSGRITLARIAALSAQGVDVISVGALTHSAPAADIALDLIL
ncbi:MAG: carboxylating nicotinate-nucleotide diphosphorylase [Polyangiales bacterium]